MTNGENFEIRTSAFGLRPGRVIGMDMTPDLSANGAEHASPGQRPGFDRQKHPKPKGRNNGCAAPCMSDLLVLSVCESRL
jgi:hypothetical protein